MNERLDQELSIARRLSLVGLVVMCAITLICVAIAAAYLLAPIPEGHGPVDASWRLCNCAGLAVLGISTALLAAFLWHFRRDANPFGGGQSLRLVAASAALAMRALMDVAAGTFPPVTIAEEPLTIALVPQSGIDLKVIVTVVFLACLAMVVRYGDALKEDSDAFV